MSLTSNLRQLSEAVGVSGEERAVRELIVKAIRDQVDELRVDTIGNVLAVKRARGRAKLRVMLDAHMDEIGFMIIGFNEDGTLQFRSIGGVDDRILPGKVVVIGPDQIPGTIGLGPIHLAHGDMSVKKIASLSIDIGASSKDEAAGAIKIGDRAAFKTQYRSLGRAVTGKAFDDRVGCAILIEILRGPRLPVDLLAAFTVQEEIGLRGAGVAAYALEPDAAIAIDATPANDLPDRLEQDLSPNTQLGGGPAIYVMTRRDFSDPRLVKHAVDVAEQLKIQYQFRQPGGGGTNAGSIGPSRAGVPSLSISVPTRYIHSPAALLYLSDVRQTIELVRESAARLTPAVLRR
jgi:putative aminopeptidase FrvX